MSTQTLVALEARSTNPEAGLLVMLHGVGSNERDLFELARFFTPQFHVVSLRAPISLGHGFAWFEVEFRPEGNKINAASEINSRRLLTENIQKLQRDFGVSADKTYLYGFSQGSIMSFSLLLTQPDLIAGAVANNGRLLPEVWPDRVIDSRLEGKKLLILHTVQDPVLKVELARSAKEKFETTPIQLDYHEFDGVHTITEPALVTALDWLNVR